MAMDDPVQSSYSAAINLANVTCAVKQEPQDIAFVDVNGDQTQPSATGVEDPLQVKREPLVPGEDPLRLPSLPDVEEVYVKSEPLDWTSDSSAQDGEFSPAAELQPCAGRPAASAGRPYSRRKPHACAACYSRFSSAPELAAHTLARHTTRDVHRCEVCSATFPLVSLLVSHGTSHRQRGHACDLCRTRFETPAGLARHRRSYHPDDKPYPCESCASTFQTLPQLARHTSRRHQGKPPLGRSDKCQAKFKFDSGSVVVEEEEEEELILKDTTSDQEEERGGKRKSRPENWERNTRKASNVNGTNKTFSRVSNCCKTNSCWQRFSEAEQRDVFARFYSMGDKNKQNRHLSKLMTRRPVARPAKTPKGGTNRANSWAYSLEVAGGEVRRACKALLCSLLQVHKSRVDLIQSKAASCLSVDDMKGRHGARPTKISREDWALVHSHCEGLPHETGHRDSSLRYFSDPDLTLHALYDMFRDYYQSVTGREPNHVSFSTYRKHFKANVDFAFRRPRGSKTK